MQTIKGLILIAATLLSLTLFISGYFGIASIFDRTMKENAQTVSAIFAQQAFNSMFQLMRRGWTRQEVEDFLEASRKTFADTPYALEIYRGPKVEQLFGAIEQAPIDQSIARALAEGIPLKQEFASGILRDIYPLKATAECVQCHTNASAGDVLGVIVVQQDPETLFAESRGKFVLSLLFISPLPFVAALFFAVFLSRRLNCSIALLDRNIESINRVSDLKSLALGDADVGFVELNNVLSKVAKLGERLRAIAVDKDLLALENRILEKCVITSEVVQDWRNYIARLLQEMGPILGARTLFAIFKADDQTSSLEIFWRHKPTEATQRLFESAVTRMLKQHPSFANIPGITIQHDISDPEQMLPELSEKDIEVKLKSLVVETPKIGGIAGIGLQLDPAQDEMRLLATESLLSTLLNLVGSVKAIYNYTKEIEYYATRDPLTKLYNQRVFWELLDYEVDRAARNEHKFALLVIDVDNFKSINDTYGHACGDKFLQEFADTIKGALRRGDVLARYGGDEFVAILPQIDGEQSYLVASRIMEHARALLVAGPDKTNIKATVSIGISVYPDHAREAKDLFLFADNMMYKAKTEGRNRVGLPAQEDVVEAFRRIGEKSITVLNAVEEKRIVPYLQPIMNVRTGQAEAYEVLSRLELGEGQLLAASEFVEVAERMGVIHKLDLIVMEKIFEKVKAENFDGLLFLNLSPRALVLDEFLRESRRLIREHDINPGNLVFELTERDTVKNITLLEKLVHELKMDGFKFAIDDFGSGFSSFHYVKRFPIDFVKIEGDFIANMIHDPRDKALVASISALAGMLGIRTVAERVESEEILRIVGEARIDFAQGYYIGRPSPDFLPGKALGTQAPPGAGGAAAT